MCVYIYIYIYDSMKNIYVFNDALSITALMDLVSFLLSSFSVFSKCYLLFLFV